MTTYQAGKEVLSYCNKCKLTLAHIIVVMKDDTTIGKVKCNTCNGNHAFKDPSTVKMKGASKRKVTRKKKSEISVSDLWMDAINKSTAKSQDYSIKNTYAIGDIIDHPKFGPGIIEKEIDNNKIEVIFRHEIKTLVHNRA